MNTIYGISEEELKEYDEAIAFIKCINDTSLFVEAVEDKDVSFKKRSANAIHNTRETMRMTGDIYNAAVDVKATQYKVTTTLIGKLASAIAHAIMGALDMATEAIKRSRKLIERSFEIPDKIKGKLSGNLTIYITCKDLQALYTQSVIVKLDRILATLTPLTESDDWNTIGLFGSIVNKLANGKFLKDDMKRFDTIHKLVANFENIRFTPTTINLKDSSNIDLYLSSNSKIAFKGLDGTSFEGSYVQGISKLLDDINTRSDTLKKLENVLGTKYKNTLENSNFEKLSSTQQNIVINGIQDVSKAVSLVAEITKYVSHDLAEVSKAVSKINTYYKNSKK